eukprot:SAG11_NODE_2655_length_3123_cov_1.476852_3_plen_53_part_00
MRSEMRDGGLRRKKYAHTPHQRVDASVASSNDAQIALLLHDEQIFYELFRYC